MMRPAFRHLLGRSALLLALPLCTCAANYKLTVASEPSGAEVTIYGKGAGVTPLVVNKVPVKADQLVTVRVSKEGYDSEERTFTLDDIRTLTRQHSDAWKLDVALAPIQRSATLLVTANEGAQVFVDNRPAGPVPCSQSVTFNRGNKSAPWSTVQVRVEKPLYLTLTRKLTAEEAAQHAGGEAWRIEFAMPEIQRPIPVDIQANVPGATVSVAGADVGLAPLKHTFVFTRADGTKPWQTVQLKISKDGFEYRPPDKDATPDFVMDVTVERATAGQISANEFVPVRFVLSSVRYYAISADAVVVQTTNILAEISQLEQDRPATQVTLAKPDNPLVVSRICAVPDQPDKIVFSIPKRESRPSSNTTTLSEIIGANLCLSSGPAQTPMTDGQQYDLDPFVSADGRWIFYSSDRLGKRCIWRMPANGRGGITKITGNLSTIDTEPALSPDGLKLAYTSRPIGARVNSPPYIWIANADGSLPTQVREGQSPGWSPDGKQVVFVSPEQKIWVMDPDGGNPTQLTQGDWNDCSPIFTPSGKHIVFASDRGLNDVKKRNYDIWMITKDGSSETQLTRNGSYDFSPAVSSDGRFLYFFSNRGAQKPGQESLQIFRLDLPK